MITDEHEGGVNACAITGAHLYYGQKHNRCALYLGGDLCVQTTSFLTMQILELQTYMMDAFHRTSRFS